MADAVELLGVRRVYTNNRREVAAVCDVTVSFPSGSFTALLGRSGCGKSTLLNLAGAMDRPTGGEVRLLGQPTRALSDDALTRLRRRQVGFVELWERRRDYPHQLSGGEMQRVAIARALANGPAVLIADEPTGNLDNATAQTVLELLARTRRELGVTVLLATHSREAAAFADRLLLMRDGRIESEKSNV